MNSKSLRQISSLAFSTTGSRVLGLVRDATFFSYFGTSLIGSAFIMAFTIPNLFRRLLGEGALSSAFLPVFSKNWSTSHAAGFKLLNQTLTRLALYFGGVTALAVATILILPHLIAITGKWEITLPMLALLLPYAVIICMAAILTASLNAMGKFFFASLSPILLNLMMIAALVIGSFYWESESLGLAYALSLGVLAGGLLQLLLPTGQMLVNRWIPDWNLSQSDEFSKVKRLFFTATGGAAILQVNVLITRVIAYHHSDEAVSQLYLASRLTELPLGVFAVAIYTVLFPLLSKYAAAEDKAAFSHTCSRGILMMTGITLPAALGLAVLSGPILSLLFEWGRFSADDVARATPVLAIYSLSVPFYALISFVVRVFHAQQDMRSPVGVSAIALVANAALSIALMIPYGVIGLASATVLSSFIQFVILMILLARKGWIARQEKIWWPTVRIITASVFMTLTVLSAQKLFPLPVTPCHLDLMVYLLVTIGAGMISYATAVFVLQLQGYFQRPEAS